MASYFEWLCERDAVKFSGVKNDLLLAVLHTTAFDIPLHSSKAVRLDTNRMADAIDLRTQYLNGEHREDLDGFKVFPSSLPSVLEILVSLSSRMAYQLPDEFDESWCFTTLVGNLFKGVDTNEVKEIYDRLVMFKTRTYGPDGFGGLFPLKNPTKDQRKVEIWYQMMAYILENF